MKPSQIVALATATLGLAVLTLEGCKQQGVQAETQSQFTAQCGGKRKVIFTNFHENLPGKSEKGWACFYVGETSRQMGSLTEADTREIFLQSRPATRTFIQGDALVRRLQFVDTGRTTLLWLGTALVVGGCTVAAAGTAGLALAGCGILLAAPALYDVLGGDPSLGSAQAWRSLGEGQKAEVECNAVNNIIEQARMVEQAGRHVSDLPCLPPSSLNANRILGAESISDLRGGSTPQATAPAASADSCPSPRQQPSACIYQQIGRTGDSGYVKVFHDLYVSRGYDIGVPGGAPIIRLRTCFNGKEDMMQVRIRGGSSLQDEPFVWVPAASVHAREAATAQFIPAESRAACGL